MALEAIAGNFALSTSTGNQSVSGIGLQPKVVLFFPTADTADGVTADCQMGFGVGIGSSERGSIAVNSEDGQGTSDTTRGNFNTKCFHLTTPGTTTALYEADFVSLDATGFTFNLTVAPASAYRVGYLAIGGDDLSNVASGRFVGGASTGNLSVTGVGFRPTGIIFFNNQDATADRSINNSIFSLGFAASVTAQGIAAIADDNNVATTITSRAQNTDDCIVIMNDVGVISAHAELFSFDSDGFTVNVTDKAASDANIYYVAFRGGSYTVGSLDTQTSTGNFSETGLGFPGKAGIFASFCSASSSSEVAGQELALGIATDSSERFSNGVVSEDNVGTSNADRFSDDGLIYQNYDLSQSVEGAIDFVSWDSDGFTLNQTDADPSANQIVYFILGDTASRTHTLDAILKAEGDTRTHVLDAALKATATKTHILDATLKGTATRTHILDAVLESAEVIITRTHILDATLKGTATRTHILDATLKAEGTTAANVLDAVLQGQAIARTHILDATLKAEGTTRTSALDAVLKAEGVTRTNIIDAVLRATITITKTHILDAVLKATTTGTHILDATLKGTATRTHILDAVLELEKTTITKTHILDAALKATATRTHILDATLKATATKTHILDATLKATATRAHILDATLKGTVTKTHILDATLRTEGVTRAHTLDATLKGTATRTNVVDSILKATATRAHVLEAFLGATTTRTHILDAVLKAAGTTRTNALDATLKATATKAHVLDAILKAEDATRTSAIDSVMKATATKTHVLDAELSAAGTTRTHVLGAKLKEESITRAHVLDAVLVTGIIPDLEGSITSVVSLSGASSSKITLFGETNNVSSLLGQTNN